MSSTVGNRRQCSRSHNSTSARVEGGGRQFVRWGGRRQGQGCSSALGSTQQTASGSHAPVAAQAAEAAQSDARRAAHAHTKGMLRTELIELVDADATTLSHELVGVEYVVRRLGRHQKGSHEQPVHIVHRRAERRIDDAELAQVPRGDVEADEVEAGVAVQPHQVAMDRHRCRHTARPRASAQGHHRAGCGSGWQQ